jgi:hypothetical protein
MFHAFLLPVHDPVSTFPFVAQVGDTDILANAPSLKRVLTVDEVFYLEKSLNLKLPLNFGQI